MPTDLQFPFQYDETGDAATVSGRDFYEQHAFILAAEAVDSVVGGSLTANETTEITSQIERTFAQSPYFQTPISVSITDVTDTELSLEARVGVDQTVTVAIPLE